MNTDNFLIDHLSASALNCFLRNEFDFFKNYICKVYSIKNTSSVISGKIYHEALKFYFTSFRRENINNIKTDAYEVETYAFEQFNKISPLEIRPRKGQTIEESQKEILENIYAGIDNFFNELPTYIDDISEVLYVEERMEAPIETLSYQIPLPFVIVCDVIYRDHSGKIKIIDHKLVSKYSDIAEVPFKYGIQFYIYKKVVEVLLKEKVENVLFFENKTSKNRDHSPQIKVLDPRFDELYDFYDVHLENVSRKVCSACSDPSYNFIPNPSDYFIDKGDQVRFYLDSLEENVDNLNVSEKTRKLLKERKVHARRFGISKFAKILNSNFFIEEDNNQLPMDATTPQKIEHTLRCFGYLAKVEHEIKGNSCDIFLVKPGAGTKTSGLIKYRLDIASALAVPNIRISSELSKYKNDVYISIEVPKEQRVFPEFKPSEGFSLGEDNFGNIVIWNPKNPSTPHLLISGASGSGKSVVLNNLKNHASDYDVIIIDPKYEFKDARLHDQDEIESYFSDLVYEVDLLFKEKGANIKQNKLIIFDEVADCLAKMTKIKGQRTLEENILIIAQKARSAGIHLVLAAQRFSVDTLKGDAKANFPARLALTTSSRVDSQVMIDQEGAELLTGKGDGLYKSPENQTPIRLQCYS